MIIKIRNKLLSFVAFFYFYFVEFFNLKKFPIIISIEGGLGAQILSYALYVKLKRKGQKVYLDCEYFQRNNLKKTLGVSYWDWQLNDYGVSMDQIDHRNRSWVYRILMLRDSPTKLQKTISALQEATFSNLFKSSNKLKKQFSSLQLKRGYGAIHIRQGDFLNVASYVEDYFTLVIMFLKMIPDKSEIVILSDSILPSKIIDLVKNEGKKIHIFDNYNAHCTYTCNFIHFTI